MDPGSSRRVPYRYSPLREDAQEIRLLTLLPGAFDSEIRIFLDKTPFTSVDVPEFEALSYAWGSEQDPVDIFVGRSGQEALAVTQNLAEALRHLRCEDEARVLWIDAICVNQKDEAERSSQVKRMADVYSKATRVIVWLGPESSDTSIAIDYVELVASKVEVDWVFHEMRPLSDQSHWADKTMDVPISPREGLAITRLFGHSWFQRLWIWQEIRLGSQNSIVLWGNRHTLFRHIRTCSLFLHTKPKPSFLLDYDLSQNIYEALQLSNYKTTHPFMSFLDLVKLTRNCKCSDPRDRIFALLYMIAENERGLGLEPDYSETVVKVYKDAFIHFTQIWQKLHLMVSMEPHDPSVGIPSWVPDWTPSLTIHDFENGCAAGATAAVIDQGTIELWKGGVLQIRGISVVQIEYMEPFQFRDEVASSRDCIENILRMASDPIFGTYISGESGLRALCKAICVGTFCEEFYPPRPGYPSLQKSQELLKYTLNNRIEYDLQDKQSNPFWYNAAFYVRGRALFLSTEGHIGLVPATAKVGDIVTVLLGCDMPMILRARNDGRYQVIGPAYCDGIMYAEELLGSIPEPYKMVLRLDETTGSNYWSLLNAENGLFQPEDVRLGRLPNGWRTKSHEGDSFYQIFEDENGNEIFHDPRLTAEALRARGVNIQVFDLI